MQVRFDLYILGQLFLSLLIHVNLPSFKILKEHVLMSNDKSFAWL